MTLTAAALLAAGPALADDRADLARAFERAMSGGHYTAQIETQVRGKPYVTEMRVVFPDRFHMKTPDAEMVILPQGTWMNAGGQWMKMPVNMSQQIAGYSKEAMQEGLSSLAEVTRTGSENIDGCTSDLYRYRVSGQFMGVKDASTAEAAVCRDNGLPVRVVSQGKDAVTIRYDFSSPVVIEPPR